MSQFWPVFMRMTHIHCIPVDVCVSVFVVMEGGEGRVVKLLSAFIQLYKTSISFFSKLTQVHQTLWLAHCSPLCKWCFGSNSPDSKVLKILATFSTSHFALDNKNKPTTTTKRPGIIYADETDVILMANFTPENKKMQSNIRIND